MGIQAIVRTRLDGESFTHKDIWRSSASCRERAKAEAMGAYYFDLASVLLVACAVEGFANYLLSIVDPSIFSDERKYFSSRSE